MGVDSALGCQLVNFWCNQNCFKQCFNTIKIRPVGRVGWQRGRDESEFGCGGVAQDNVCQGGVIALVL